MIEKALRYLIDLGHATIRDVKLPDGTVQTYTDKPLTQLKKHHPMADSIKMSTLSSLVEYIRANIDHMADKMIIHVVSPGEVSLFSQLNDERDREYLVSVKAQIPAFQYERFIDNETFCINVQAKFFDDPGTDKELLLKFAGTVESGTIAEYGDDGVTQKATVRQGITSKESAIVPNSVKLRPYRTFIEVEQPVSEFIFRMKDAHGICCALFEADGGAWKIDAMENIKVYLQEALSDLEEQFAVIS